MNKLDQMVKEAKKLGITSDDLRWFVDKNKYLEADKINNRGFRSQLRYLLAGPKMTLKKLRHELTSLNDRIKNSED